MKTSQIFLLLLLIFIAAGNATAQGKGSTAAKGEKIESIRQKIIETNKKMMDTFNRGDLLGTARFYTDDATIFYHRGGKIEGREAIDRYWTGIKGAKNWKLEVLEVGGDKETVYQIGRSSLTSEREGKESTYVCDFVVIWKLQQDGSYKIHVDIYN